MKALLWVLWNGRSNRVLKKNMSSLKFCGDDSCFSIHHGLWFYIYFYEIKSVVKTVIHIHMMCCFVFSNLFLCTFLQIMFFFPISSNRTGCSILKRFKLRNPTITPLYHTKLQAQFS